MALFRRLVGMFQTLEGAQTTATLGNASSTSGQDHIGTFRRLGPTHRIWPLEENHRRIWITLEPKLWDLIQRLHPDNELPLSMHAYMIGPSFDRAEPTVIMDCSHPRFLRRVSNQILGSRILNEPDNRGPSPRRVKFQIVTGSSPRDWELLATTAPQQEDPQGSSTN